MHEPHLHVDPWQQPSFGLRNRILRAIWGFAWITLFRFSPKPMHAWRRLILICFGARVGRNVHVYPKVQIWAPWNLDLHEESSVGNGAILYSMATITLGKRAIVSQGAHLCTGSHDIDSPSFQLITKPISVGDGCWVCAEAFLGPGVALAKESVVGARAVVTRPVTLESSVWAGNPARFVRYRSLRA